jgi:peptidyl-prolyl cis-trans isomerase B (cyclophilin B)
VAEARRLPVRAATLVAVLALLAGCGGDDEAADATTVAPAPPNPDCREVSRPEPRPPAMREAPTTIMNADERVDLLVKTSCGSFTITLEPQTSPNAVASFVALAKDDYFDGTYFHRIVPGFVIQGGDPTGTGTGGPGYTTVDPPGSSTTYERGVVAMAKTPTEPRGAAGSQFFVVTGEGVQLPPDYAVIGRVTKGLDVVEQIGELGDPTTEIPTQPVVIDDVVVERP